MSEAAVGAKQSPQEPLRLICPRDRHPLAAGSGEMLVCDRGHRYPVVEGVPVLLRDDVAPTLDVARGSLARAWGRLVDERAPELYLESLGVSEAEKQQAIRLFRERRCSVDPVVQALVPATCGNAYRRLIARLDRYPIPDLHLGPGTGKTLLDIGCNWGRWSIASARKGYRVVGIDPSLGAVMAARRISRDQGLDIDYVVADARYLPFGPETFDSSISYYVLQHLSYLNATKALAEIGRVLKREGECLVQMPHALGIKNVFTSLHRRLDGRRRTAGFDVRYWTAAQLRRSFEKHIGPCALSAHCYLGLQLEPSDRDMLPTPESWLVAVSDLLCSLSRRIPGVLYLADSFDVACVKSGRPVRANGAPHAPEAAMRPVAT